MPIPVNIPSPRVQPSPRVSPPPQLQVPPDIPPNSTNMQLQNKTKDKMHVPTCSAPKVTTNWQKRFLRPTQARIRRTGHEQYRGLAADYLYAQHIFSPPTANMFHANHIFDDNGSKQSLDKLLQGKHGPTRWLPALSNKWGRLAQSNDLGVESTDTIDFIDFNQIPTNKKVTYASFACDHRPLKDEKWRICIVVGGDKLTYDADSGSPAANMLETKLLFNSVISDASKGARFCSMDLKDIFYILQWRIQNS